MRHLTHLALSATLLAAVAGCGQPTATQAALKISESKTLVAQAIAQAQAPVVKDLGNANGPSVAVTIEPASAQRSVQALQHRWVAGDIATYHVSLTSQNSGQVVATLDVTPAAYNTSTASAKAFAAFTGLPGNDKYTVAVVARGTDPTNAGAGAVDMNTQTAATAVFDFLEDANHNIETVSNQTINVVLDSFVFSGTGNVKAQVTDGAFKPDPAGIQASAAMPAPGLYYVDSNSDMVGNQSYGPDGVKDGHYRYVHNFTQPTTVSGFDGFNWNFSGRWDSLTYSTHAYYGTAIIGVFINGVAQTQSLPYNAGTGQWPQFQQPVGTFSGLTVVDLYVPGVQDINGGPQAVWAFVAGDTYSEANGEGLVAN